MTLVKFNKIANKQAAAAASDNTVYFPTDEQAVYLNGRKVGEANTVTSVNGKTGDVTIEVPGTSDIVDVNADGFYVVDSEGYIGLKLTTNGLESKILNVDPTVITSLSSNGISVTNGGNSPIIAGRSYYFVAQGTNLSGLTTSDIRLPEGSTITDFSANNSELTFTITFGNYGGDIVINNDFKVLVTPVVPRSTIMAVGGVSDGGVINLLSGANTLTLTSDLNIGLSDILVTKNSSVSGTLYAVACSSSVIGLISETPGSIIILDPDNHNLSLYSARITVDGSKPKKAFLIAYTNPEGAGTLEVNDVEQTDAFFIPVQSITQNLNVIPAANYTFVNWTKNGVEYSTEQNLEVLVEEGSALTLVANLRGTE